MRWSNQPGALNRDRQDKRYIYYLCGSGRSCAADFPNVTRGTLVVVKISKQLPGFLHVRRAKEKEDVAARVSVETQHAASLPITQTPEARRRFLRRIQNAPDRGTKGKIRWSREELHER